MSVKQQQIRLSCRILFFFFSPNLCCCLRNVQRTQVGTLEQWIAENTKTTRTTEEEAGGKKKKPIQPTIKDIITKFEITADHTFSQTKPKLVDWFQLSDWHSWQRLKPPRLLWNGSWCTLTGTAPALPRWTASCEDRLFSVGRALCEMHQNRWGAKNVPRGRGAVSNVWIFLNSGVKTPDRGHGDRRSRTGAHVRRVVKITSQQS